VFQFHVLPVTVSEVGSFYVCVAGFYSENKTVCSNILLGDKLMREGRAKYELKNYSEITHKIRITWNVI
jgi:hypothetical protein